MTHPQGHLVLIDASGMLHRANSVGRKEQNEAGTEIGMTKIFGSMLMKLIHKMGKGKVPPTAVAVIFDPARENTWRREISPAYKANRPEYDPDFLAQLPLVREMCQRMGLGVGLSETHEADDMIAAYAQDGIEAGMNVAIISADKDLMQIVRKGIMQYNPQSETWFNTKGVEAKMGVPSHQIRDMLALMGDEGDGVKGAPGVGPKTAAKLLAEHGDLETVLRMADTVKSEKIRLALIDNRDQILLAQRLVSLDVDGCERPFALGDLRAPDRFKAGEAMSAWQESVLMTYAPETESPTPT